MTKLELTWKTAQGMRTITTTRNDGETLAAFLERHQTEATAAQNAFPVVE